MSELQQGQVTAEGATLSEALMKAAQSLGVERDLVLGLHGPQFVQAQ